MSPSLFAQEDDASDKVWAEVMKLSSEPLRDKWLASQRRFTKAEVLAMSDAEQLAHARYSQFENIVSPSKPPKAISIIVLCMLAMIFANGFWIGFKKRKQHASALRDLQWRQLRAPIGWLLITSALIVAIPHCWRLLHKSTPGSYMVDEISNASFTVIVNRYYHNGPIAVIVAPYQREPGGYMLALAVLSLLVLTAAELRSRDDTDDLRIVNFVRGGLLYLVPVAIFGGLMTTTGADHPDQLRSYSTSAKPMWLNRENLNTDVTDLVAGHEDGWYRFRSYDKILYAAALQRVQRELHIDYHEAETVVSQIRSEELHQWLHRCWKTRALLSGTLASVIFVFPFVGNGALENIHTIVFIRKRCGVCGQPVPLTARVGGVCPHCHQRWDRLHATYDDRSVGESRPAFVLAKIVALFLSVGTVWVLNVW